MDLINSGNLVPKRAEFSLKKYQILKTDSIQRSTTTLLLATLTKVSTLAEGGVEEAKETGCKGNRLAGSDVTGPLLLEDV